MVASPPADISRSERTPGIILWEMAKRLRHPGSRERNSEVHWILPMGTCPEFGTGFGRVKDMGGSRRLHGGGPSARRAQHGKFGNHLAPGG